MLIGEFSHTMDTKGRMIFPLKLRESLGDKFIVSKGLDNCLFVYSIEEWGILSEKIKSMPLSKARNIQRFLFSGATQVEPDKQGRILIPSNLREYANLDKDVLVAGASNRAEIWSKSSWDNVCTEMDSSSVIEVMDELGF
ncbi:MAG: division/cell wall cluster transcriptional repressor MraZ [Oscillospiraceae bacterium]